MTDLSPLTALGAAAPRRQSFGALTIWENADMALASLALRRGGTPPQPFGLTLPAAAGWQAADGIAAFWTAPGQWMIEAAGRATADFAADLAAAAPGCSVTEQTDGWVCFELAAASQADALRRLLEKLVNIAPEQLQPGTALRTGLDHQSVFLLRRAPDHLAIWGMRSAARSLWHAITSAAEQQTVSPG